MKCRTKAILHGLGLLALFWLSAGIPEYMDWKIFLKLNNPEPVEWFGLHWIMTSIAAMTITSYNLIKVISICEDKR